MRLIWTLSWAIGCSAAVPATGPCSAADRAAIGVHYEERVKAECPPDGKTLEECPAYPSIAAERAKAREEWILCQRK